MSEADKSATALVKPPELSGGQDGAIAKQLIKLFTDAQRAGRRIMALGLFAMEIRDVKLKHGQFGPWLAHYAPKLTRTDSKTGKPKPSSSLSSYMSMTTDVLRDMGYTPEKYFAHISNSQALGICRGANFLALNPKRLTPDALALRDQIFERVDGRTAKQIAFKFGQVEEDDSGKQNTKRGRLKGQGGASAEQRAAAKAAEEQARIDEIELSAKDTGKWMDEVSDAKGIALIPDKAFTAYFEKLEAHYQFCRQLKQSRKS